MVLLVIVELVLLPVVSWMSLITYEAHMADPVELLSILLIEEQRITRKMSKNPAGAASSIDAAAAEPAANKRRRPEMAQTRAAVRLHPFRAD